MSKGKKAIEGSGDASLQAETLSMMKELGLSTDSSKKSSAKPLSNGKPQQPDQKKPITKQGPLKNKTAGTEKIQKGNSPQPQEQPQPQPQKQKQKQQQQKPKQQQEQKPKQHQQPQQQQQKPFVVPQLSGSQTSKARKEPAPKAPSSTTQSSTEKIQPKAFDAKAFTAKAFNGNGSGNGKSNQKGNNKGSVQQIVSHKWWASGKDTQRSVVPPDENSAWHTLQKVDVAEPSKEEIPEATLLVTISNAVRSAFEEEVNSFQKAKSSKLVGDQKWISDVLKSGTASDKVAALALVVQESPVHELAALDSLITIAGKTEQRTSHLALEALKDLLIHNLLPDRHLRAFSAQPLLNSGMDRTAGLLFWFESELLQRVLKIVDAIENGMKSNIEFFKKQCMDIAAELLGGKPEQESRLLALLVNKLGDPSNSVCSKTIELLKNTVRTHPAMKGVVVREVRQLIYRPGMHLRTVHNGVVFLSQVVLSVADHEVAAQLVDCYMSLFEKAVKQNELKSRLLSIILHGIDKAFPFLKNKEPVTKHADTLFRLIHSESFSTTTRALMLLSHVALAEADAENLSKGKYDKNNKKLPANKAGTAATGSKGGGADGAEIGSIVNRYYRALYNALLSPQVTTRSQNTLFFNLLFRSMKKDPSDHRLMAFVKRLAICALQSSAPIAAGIVYLMSEVVRSRPSITDMLSKLEKPQPSKNNEKEVEVDGDESAAAAAAAASSMHQLGNYEASKLEPTYAVTSTPSLWEASLLLHHFHPSVKSFMNSFVDEPHKIVFGGDPTVEFSLASFLNRFAYKNPKKQHSDKIHRPAAQSREEDPVNAASFLTKSYADTAPDKRFFLKFFGEKQKLKAEGKARDRSKRKQKRGEDGDEDGGGGAGIAGDDDDDDEGGIDAFADRLAEDLMRDTENAAGPVDIDDFSDDDLGSFGDSDDDGDDADFKDAPADSDDDDDDDEEDAAQKGRSKPKSSTNNNSKKADNRKATSLVAGDGSDGGRLFGGDDDSEGMDVDRDDDSDGDDDQEDFDMGDDDDDDDDGDDLDFAFEATGKGAKKRGIIDGISKSNKNKRSKNSDFSDFAAAEDYEDQMEEIVQMHALKTGGNDAIVATAAGARGAKNSSKGIKDVSKNKTTAISESVKGSSNSNSSSSKGGKKKDNTVAVVKKSQKKK